MKIATATLKSVSPYSQSLMHEAPKLEREGHAEYEERTWREKMHYDRKTGEVFIPPTAFKESLACSSRRRCRSGSARRTCRASGC